MGLDMKTFYLGTPMDRFEYMKIILSIFTEHITQQDDLERNTKKGFIYLEIIKAIYGLPAAGRHNYRIN